jgi:AcrR family transcriptional regulator
MTTQETPSKARRGKVTRDKIIEIAESLIARHGPDGFQLQNVTELLGITPPAIYNHFKDRDDLVAQVAQKGGRLLEEKMRRQPDEDILSSLRRNAREYVAFLAKNPAHARIILWDMARQGTSGWRGLAASNIQIRTRMHAAFETAAETGEIRPLRVETYLQFLYIGAAAAITWTEYNPDGGTKVASSHDEGSAQPAGLPAPTEGELAQLQDEVENLVIRLLAPDKAPDSPETAH